MAGRWEFPGGKCEPGETPEAATARECLEEVGVEVEVGRLERRTRHRYPHAFVELSYYHCRMSEPTAEPAPGSGFRWVPAAELAGYQFPDANEPVVEALAREALDGMVGGEASA